MSYYDYSEELRKVMQFAFNLTIKFPALVMVGTMVGVKNVSLLMARSLRNLVVSISDAVSNEINEQRLKMEQRQCEEYEKLQEMARLRRMNFKNIQKRVNDVDIVYDEQFVEQSINAWKTLMNQLTIQERKIIFPSHIREEVQELSAIDVYDTELDINELIERVKRLNNDMETLEEETVATICTLRGREYVPGEEIEITADEILEHTRYLIELFGNFERKAGCKWVENMECDENRVLINTKEESRTVHKTEITKKITHK